MCYECKNNFLNLEGCLVLHQFIAYFLTKLQFLVECSWPIWIHQVERCFSANINMCKYVFIFQATATCDGAADEYLKIIYIQFMVETFLIFTEINQLGPMQSFLTVT